MIDNKILNKLWITLENQFENCYYILYRQNIAHIKARIWLASFYHQTVNLMTMGILINIFYFKLVFRVLFVVEFLIAYK